MVPLINVGPDGGVCPSLLITPQYMEGGGDTQTANPAWRGKEGRLPHLYIDSHMLMFTIRDLALLLDGDVRLFLQEWYVPATFGLCSCMSIAGRRANGEPTSWYDVDNRVFDLMKRHIDPWKTELGGTPGFVYYLEPNEIVRLAERSYMGIRELEISFREWRREEADSQNSALDKIGKLLNRMSTYLYWLCRYEARRAGIKESYSPRTLPGLPEGLL